MRWNTGLHHNKIKIHISVFLNSLVYISNDYVIWWFLLYIYSDIDNIYKRHIDINNTFLI